MQYEHAFVRSTGISSVDECDTSFQIMEKEWQKWTWHVLRETVWSASQYSGTRRRGVCRFHVQDNPCHSKPLRRSFDTLVPTARNKLCGPRLCENMWEETRKEHALPLPWTRNTVCFHGTFSPQASPSAKGNSAHAVKVVTLFLSRQQYILRGRTIKFANSSPCACRGSTGQKP